MYAVRLHKGSPFLGLRSFEIDDAQIFFGQTEVRNQIYEAVEAKIAQR